MNNIPNNDLNLFVGINSVNGKCYLADTANKKSAYCTKSLLLFVIFEIRTIFKQFE